MNTPAAPRASLPARVLRSATTAGLALATMLLLAIAALGLFPTSSRLLSASAFMDAGQLDPVAAIAVALTILLVPGGVIYLLRRRGWLTDRVLVIGWALVLAASTWLAWDDSTVRHPLPTDEFSPTFPGAAESYAVLMRYGSQSDDPAPKAFLARQPAVTLGAKPSDPAKWRDFITTHRVGLAADWVALEPERRWVAELAAFERIGDLTAPNPAAPIPRFQVWRTLAQRTAAQASLLALEGRGDEAIATLLPLLEVSLKLEPSSRTLVRAMIARVVQRQMIETANFVLDQTTVSPAQKARLATLLATVDATAGVRRIMLIEYALFNPVFGQMRLGQVSTDRALPALLRYPLNALSALFYNPNATANRYGDLAYALADLAEKRDLEGLAARQEEFTRLHGTRIALKNPGGRLLLALSVPAFKQLVKNYWSIDDLRTALVARLRS